MSFFDSWLAFNTCFDKGNFSAFTQLVGYKLLAVDNELQHPESFTLVDRELMTRAGIKSGQTIVEARRQLKNAGLIDFKAGKGSKPTRYSIKQESSKNDDSIKQDSSEIQASGIISYTLQRQEEEKRNEDDDAGARKTGKVAAATGKDADAHTQAKPLSSPTFDANDIQAEWVKAFGYDLRGNYALELERLASKDYARAQAAIARTLAKKKSRESAMNFPTSEQSTTA